MGTQGRPMKTSFATGRVSIPCSNLMQFQIFDAISVIFSVYFIILVVTYVSFKQRKKHFEMRNHTRQTKRPSGRNDRVQKHTKLNGKGNTLPHCPTRGFLTLYFNCKTLHILKLKSIPQHHTQTQTQHNIKAQYSTLTSPTQQRTNRCRAPLTNTVFALAP
jgi:hypothetical protein